MFKSAYRALPAFALLVASSAHAQQAQPAAPAPAPVPVVQTVDADPALWVVKDADTTIYLFGTIHILKPGLSWFDEAVKTAFDKSDEVMLEMVEPDPATLQGLVIKLAIAAPGVTLTDKLPADKRAGYAKMLSDLSLPPAAFDPMDPWFAALALSVAPLAKLGYDANQGAEKVLTAAANASGKKLAGFETPEQQLGYLDRLSEDAQIKFLVSTIDDYPKLGGEIADMVDRWSKGDAEGLGKTMNESVRDTPELAKTLLIDRNVRWADWISTRMAQPGTVFVAVGAGHLAGADSLQTQLAKHKLTVTRITY